MAAILKTNDKFWDDYMALFSPQVRRAIYLSRAEARSQMLPQAKDEKEQFEHHRSIAAYEKAAGL